MRNAAKHITSWLLLAVLFVSTSGFTVYSHMCNMQMPEQTAMPAVHSCCAEASAESPAECAGSQSAKALVQFSQSCCASTSSYIKFNFTANQQSNNTQLQHIAFIYVMPFTSKEPAIIAAEEFRSAYQSLPPPKAGRDILLQQDLLRI